MLSARPKAAGSFCCLLRSPLSAAPQPQSALAAGDICKIILAVLLPPLGVFAEKEKCDTDLGINIVL